MSPIKLNVLLVEDNTHDMKTYIRDFPEVFLECGVDVEFHPIIDFDKALALIKSTHIRFDLILSDTYRGDQKNRDAAVIAMVQEYKSGRFCPLIVFSASVRPEALATGAFVAWADKATPGEIESAIKQMLETGIPQLARSLHDELDKTAGSFLWEFLEINWERLLQNGNVGAKSVDRLVRRRAALQLAEICDGGDGPEPVGAVAGLEYYTYPPLHKNRLRLGTIIKHNSVENDIRVVLTPHCHLTIQPKEVKPRAENVLVVRTISAVEMLGADKIAHVKEMGDLDQDKHLKTWTNPPSKGDVCKPAGRLWYLPALLEIPHSYCDFQQIETLPYDDLFGNYTAIATLTPPFSESLQSCFIAYHSGVGIPNLVFDSIRSLLQ